MKPSLKYYQDQLEKNKDEILETFFEFLKFKSISTLPKHKKDVENCAHWVQKHLSKIGFKTEIWETSGHPTVFAENLDAGPDKPTLLMYQHYDVQPVDPENLWDSPPFEPTLKGGSVYARGASDNKGQAFYVFTALKMIYEKYGHYPLNIKLLVEGEEETGSEGLMGILDKYKPRLETNYLTIVDVDIPKEDVPAINMSTRGIMSYTLDFEGSNTDLHSGIHGGIAYNPLRALTEVLAQFYSESGKVTLPHFYDDVKKLSSEEKEDLYLEFDEIAYELKYGTKPTGGEKKFSPLERSGNRPTFEINGIWGGYNEEGFKTVIPAKAHAKVSMRLVANQDPQKIDEEFRRYIQTLVPEGIKLTIKSESEPAPPFLCPFKSKLVDAASKAYELVFEKPCKKIMGGGSLPIAYELQKATTNQTLAFGVGLSTDKIHAPNEHFSLDRFNQGALIITQFIEELAGS